MIWIGKADRFGRLLDRHIGPCKQVRCVVHFQSGQQESCQQVALLTRDSPRVAARVEKLIKDVVNPTHTHQLVRMPMGKPAGLQQAGRFRPGEVDRIFDQAPLAS